MANDSRYVLRTVPGVIGAGTLVAAAVVAILYLDPANSMDYADEGVIISSICSFGNAIGVLIYRRQNRRAALGFIIGMIGWATVFLGLAMMNRDIIGSSLISLVPAGLMLLGAWYFSPDGRQVYDAER